MAAAPYARAAAIIAKPGAVATSPRRLRSMATRSVAQLRPCAPCAPLRQSVGAIASGELKLKHNPR
jgi:hypothetical protein